MENPTLIVTFDGSVFYPETSLELEPNKRYKIQIISKELSSEKPSENAWDVLESLAGTIDAPDDWSSEHDHYLYGTPKHNMNYEQG
jgi:hypothetical protein